MMALAAGPACNNYIANDSSNKGIAALAKKSCADTAASKECRDLSAEMKKKGEKPEDKMMSCQNPATDSFETSRSYISGCAVGGWDFVKDSAVGLFNATIGGAAQAVSKIVTDSKNENAINAICDKDIKFKRALIQQYNDMVPELLKKDIPSDAILQSANCAGIKSTLKAWQAQKTMDVSGALQRQVAASGKGSLTAQQKEFVAWQRSLLPPKVDLVAAAKAQLTKMGVKFECYNDQARAAMMCEAIAAVASVAIPGAIAIKAARLKNIAELAEVAGDTEKVAEAGAAAQAGGSAGSSAAQNMKLASEASQKIKAGASQKDILQSVGQINDAADGGAARLQLAQDVLGRPLTPAEQKWILSAHNDVAPDKAYRLNGGDSPDEYSVADLKAKLNDRPATVTQQQTRDLMENGILGNSTSTAADPALRLQAQKGVITGLEKGSPQAVSDGIKAGRAYYKKMLDNPASLHADARGANDIIEANTYGLKTKESADLFEKFLAANHADPAQNFRSMIGSLSKDIDRLQKLKTQDVEFNAYKIWREKELRYELIQRYYAKKYPDKWGDIDIDQLRDRESNIRQQLYDDIQKARAYAEKRDWPGTDDLN